jgi:AcrR family transcriptional regulator
LPGSFPRPSAGSVGPSRKTAKKRHDEAVDAAAAVFAERGYAGASTQEIARRLGVQQGSLYYYFPSKDAALEEVCRRGVAGFVQNLEAVLASDLPMPAKVRGLIAGHLEPMRTRRNYVHVFLRDRRVLPTPARRKIGRLSRRYERLAEQLFRRGVAEGLFRADLDCRMVTLAVIGMCNAAVPWYGSEPDASIERITDAFARLVIDGSLVK